MKKFLFVFGFLLVGTMVMPASTEAQSSGAWRTYDICTNECFAQDGDCYPDDLIVIGKPILKEN